MDSMMPDEKKQAILVKGGIALPVDLGFMSNEEFEQLRQLSPESLQDRLSAIWDSVPESQKLSNGYCKDAKTGRHMSYAECLNCGLDIKGFRTIPEWDACKKLNIGGSK